MTFHQKVQDFLFLYFGKDRECRCFFSQELFTIGLKLCQVGDRSFVEISGFRTSTAMFRINIFCTS